MFKRFIGLVCLVLSISSVFAATNQEMIEYSHTFQPNQKESFSNPFFWTVDVQCYARLEDGSATFHARILDQSGTLNGQKLKKGQEITMSISHGEHINVSADAWASVEVANISPFPVTMTCNV